MVVITRFSMVGIEDCCRSTDQDRTGDQPLEMRGRLEQSFELRISLASLHQNLDYQI